ncbi:TraB/GumN family protein [Myxococcota bacterium]|nr:TraB/GumN family protein [Myxococcota bacterium]MBU1433049.1 TraB/GumN family protein [Myxococcota bacterium]MBU1899916.1 TraB/GumN family protein [Myxococcota bacterium]
MGTAHISEKSVQEVRETIKAVQPDSVCVELCSTRYESLNNESRFKNLDIFQVIKKSKVLFVLANLVLSSYQKRLGDKLGVRPGAEQLEAIRVAKEIGAELVLADRDIQATLKRTWRNLSLFNKAKVFNLLIESFFSKEEISEEDLERLKEKDHLSEMMSEFAKVMPQIQKPLIDERDRFLMSAVEDAPGTRIVAVVGAGHVEGMVRYQGQGADRAALSTIPPPSRWVGLLKWVIPALILLAFYFGYREHAGAGLKEMIFAWTLPNALAAGLLSALVGAKPLSVLTAIVASPITSLNPTIGAGMVVGLVEAWLRKPTVGDMERLGEDTMTVKGLFRNPFTRVLIVAVASTIGSALGAYIGAAYVLSLL